MSMNSPNLVHDETSHSGLCFCQYPEQLYDLGTEIECQVNTQRIARKQKPRLSEVWNS